MLLLSLELGARGEQLHNCAPSCGLQWIELLQVPFIMRVASLMPAPYTCDMACGVSCIMLQAPLMSLNPRSLVA
jgi:hypothetical protein